MTSASTSSPESTISWLRSEFAAANAIIDALCRHLAGDSSGAGDYAAVFAALHRRRANWVPVLHMQRFYSIADVSNELGLVEERRKMSKNYEECREEVVVETEEESLRVVEKAEKEYSENCPVEGVTEKGSEEQHSSPEGMHVCSNQDDCLTLPERIKILKGFVAKEAVKGHMVNVVKGLKIYEDIFIESELTNLYEYIDELRLAGRNGELAGETFIFFNKQMKGNKREIIQLGVPLFQPTNNETSSNIEQIPPALQSIIDHLVQWRLVPENRKPNSCIINFFDENEHSQPYFKPPHLDNPISTLVLNETTMAFGRAIAGDANGNYKGSLTLDIKEGSVLIMRGNSSDIARHVICPSSNKRVTITFLKVKPSSTLVESPKTPLPSKAMTLWQPGTPQIPKVPPSGFIAYGHQTMVPTAYGLAFRTPVVMLAPPRTIVMSPPSKQTTRSGTGVFLPWTVSHKKYTKHLPPRMQKRRQQLASLPSPLDAEV